MDHGPVLQHSYFLAIVMSSTRRASFEQRAELPTDFAYDERTDETIASHERCNDMDESKTESVPVLLVEDDPLVRMDTASFLEGAGFVVHEADNAAAPIRSLELHDEIRLIFTDVNMPG